MEGTNIYLKDPNISNIHSYYGNGCPNEWGSDGTTGSTTSCETRLTTTFDGEYQKNGTYYNYQSSSLETGATLSTESSVIPDTFCPLGWQLPYSGTGGDYYDKSRSYKYLVNTYGITSSTQGNSALRSYPFSYILGGFYGFDQGRLYLLSTTGAGFYWSNTVSSTANSYRFALDGIYAFREAAMNNKTYAYPLR